MTKWSKNKKSEENNFMQELKKIIENLNLSSKKSKDFLLVISHLKEKTYFTDNQILYLLDKEKSFEEIEVLSETLNHTEREIRKICSLAEQTKHDPKIILKKARNYSKGLDDDLFLKIFNRLSNGDQLLKNISNSHLSPVYRFTSIATEILQWICENK